jgi:hypothetical protein
VGDAIAGQHVRCQHGRMLWLLGNFAVFKRMANGQIVEVVPVDDACEGPKDALPVLGRRLFVVLAFQFHLGRFERDACSSGKGFFCFCRCFTRASAIERVLGSLPAKSAVLHYHEAMLIGFHNLEK